MKIQLEIKPEKRSECLLRQDRESGFFSFPLKMALPFFRSKQGFLIHRIRSGKVHHINATPSHVSLTYWCANIGFLGKGTMMGALPDKYVLCAACEGKAIGAGVCGAREINGRKVLFRPRI